MKPTVSYFRVFGCVCYVFVPSHLRSKFDKKAVRCIFVGYDNQRKGWRCCDPTSGRCYTSRDVVFDEASSWWSLEKKVLPDSENIEEVLKQKMGEQTAHIWSSVDTPEDPSDTDVIEQEVTQTSNAGERETPPPQLRRTERIRKPNPKCSNHIHSISTHQWHLRHHQHLLLNSTALSYQLWKYRVFLSFRREDTRNTFVGHLYSALENQGIYTYKGDKTLPRGELIGPSLKKAIEESQMSIIVFSENYADSSWCLEELAYIMKCRETRGQIVIPIFYGVEPSELRKQKHKYGQSFVKHEVENKINKVESWRKALVDASNISGWDSKDIANRHESEFIKKIVGKISKMLHPLTSRVNENLVGIEVCMQDLKSKLTIGSSGVLMVGIWGIGGSGKTTLASSFYKMIFTEFDGCCFLENIREESSKYGLKRLQEEMLSGILKRFEGRGGGEGGGRGVEEGKSMIKDMLCRRKILIVLDDVDQLEQLQALAGSHDWFGAGSLIIITTRDEHLLMAHNIDVMHNISLLTDDEAIQLFCMHAPWSNTPMDDYGLLSKEVVRWVKKDRAMEMLDACGFHPVIGVKVLMQKTLITISNGIFDMHDLVHEMAHHIVRGEHPENPEKHSRVWKKEDVQNTYAMDAMRELDMIEAVRFEYSWDDPLQRLPSIVANMKNLRWIYWKGDLTSPLPTNFSPRKLRCLLLRENFQRQLWEGIKFLPNLKIMKLWFLKKLVMTPDFNGLPNLERFILDGCECLEEIHPSIGRLEKLVFLYIDYCLSLKMFPVITQLKKLKTLSFIDCRKLFKLSEIQQNMDRSHLDNKNIWANCFVTLLTCCSNLRGNIPQEDLINVEEGVGTFSTQDQTCTNTHSKRRNMQSEDRTIFCVLLIHENRKYIHTRPTP
ncbi:unnamed protein product [Lactuca virosa]|uniref:TIR domain-containing protein n=1 Tax=Lactuca virosa TaxID=75947 RepID=A0AAU9M410_9ASTR|nr:unnamed protein product [Lactuca virosa]